jgi:hypothetical protein
VAQIRAVARPPTHLAVGADVEKESKAVLISPPSVSMSALVRRRPGSGVLLSVLQVHLD